MKQLSSSLAAAVKAASPSVVRVGARRWPTSGIAWSSDGHIVTTARAVGDRTEQVAVTLADGSEHQARVVGRDAGTDLALLHVDGAAVEPLEFTGADELEVGNLVLALGRPGRSVRASLRIVGVLGDEVQTRLGGRLDRYIESDRHIPRGFSGGPLITASGRAVGMNTNALMRGADLAVPRATIERVVADLQTHGGVRRGYLGIGAYPVELPAKLARELEQERGALIVAVEEGSPAEAAGLHIGDIIVSVADEPVSRPGHIRALLHDRDGAQVNARIVRTGALGEVTFTVGARS